MATNNPQFINISAAADYMGNGAIELPEYQKDITDLVKRAGVLGNRISYVPATGSISRFFEQTAIADGQVVDPRNIGAGVSATSPTRIEKSLLIKAITNQVNFGLFDLETTAQQGVFAQLKAKDLTDMVNGIIRLNHKKLWVGGDTVSGNQVGGGTPGSNDYVGLVNQITKTAVIAPTDSIVDGIRAQVAQLMADQDFDLIPTAIYINPIALSFLENEVRNSNGAVQFIQTTLDGTAGLSVNGIMTAAGVLPLISESFLGKDITIPGISAAAAGKANYPFAILTESLVEYHYVGSKQPRVFQLGTLSSLSEQYIGVQFGAPVVKAAGTAHVIGVIQR
jgi:hypothetical protein